MAQDPLNPARARRLRTTGKVKFSHDERVKCELVALSSISRTHRDIVDRDARLDLATASLADLEAWDPQALDVLLRANPPWVMERGPAATRYHELICGGHFLPALRRLKAPDFRVPVVVVDSKFKAQRIVQLAAAHAAALTAAAACLSPQSVRRLMVDATTMGAPVLTVPPKRQLRALGLSGTARQR